MARLKITQVKSRIGSTERQCKNLDALGLKRINASVEHDDSVIIKGMIARVKHLVKVEEVAPAKKAAPKAKKAHQAYPSPACGRLCRRYRCRHHPQDDPLQIR